MLGAPIFVDGDLIGVMDVITGEPCPSAIRKSVDPDFADQAAIAIANARLLETTNRQPISSARSASPEAIALRKGSTGLPIVVDSATRLCRREIRLDSA